MKTASPKYRLMRTDPGFCRVLYRSLTGRIYCIQDDGGWGKQNLTFYQCSQDGEPQAALGFMPGEDEFDVYLVP